MRSECLQSVFRVCSECLQSAFKVRSECLQSLFRVCFECVQSGFRVCSECVQSVFNIDVISSSSASSVSIFGIFFVFVIVIFVVIVTFAVLMLKLMLFLLMLLLSLLLISISLELQQQACRFSRGLQRHCCQQISQRWCIFKTRSLFVIYKSHIICVVVSKKKPMPQYSNIPGRALVGSSGKISFLFLTDKTCAPSFQF